MTDLTVFIMEKLSSLDSKYGVELMLVDNDTKCKDLSEDDFVNALSTDIKNALKIYLKEVTPEREEATAAMRKRMLDKAVEYAEAKWKHKAKQTEYIEQAKQKIDKEELILSDNIDKFVTNLPGDGWTSSYLSIGCNPIDKKHLHNLAKKLQDTKMYELIDGWVISYPAEESSQRKKSLHNAHITFKLPAELQDKIDVGASNLAAALDEFYKSGKYTGD